MYEIPKKTALVLGGGGLKGFAHIGVVRALVERGITPSVLAGTSIGSMIAAAHASGMSVGEMADRALSLRRRDLFRINHMGMLLERMHSPSLYLEEPLRALCESVSPPGTFEELDTPLLVNTVDAASGTRVVWGLPGLRDVPVVDAVYASCSLPGFFPPGDVGGRKCIDGGTVDNLPVAIASLGMDAIIAVDVGTTELARRDDIALQGFATIYMRAATIMMHALQVSELAEWKGPPMLLLRPPVSYHHWFSFANTAQLIEAGYAAASRALDQLGDSLVNGTGIYPRRMVELSVDPERCIGCGTCVALAPDVMEMGSDGKAHATPSPLEWSPADGDFVQECPTEAITVRSMDGMLRTTRPMTETTLDAADD
ncbi:MAG TPA: patatin-like phospholipase family protein [Gemmatimonadaceae bacterium]|nr:patatin-like phospholipase family protein [Gemmatimonadaceae bacterium]